MRRSYLRIMEGRIEPRPPRLPLRWTFKLLLALTAALFLFALSYATMRWLK